MELFGLAIPAGIAGFLLLSVVVMYNSLVRIRNHCDEAWADVETELKRRYNLIPNLVNTVKGYAAHERELLEQVVRLREECGNKARRGNRSIPSSGSRPLCTASCCAWRTTPI